MVAIPELYGSHMGMPFNTLHVSALVYGSHMRIIVYHITAVW